MIHISELLQLLERWRDDHSFRLKWISPEDVTGLNRNDIFKARETEDWTSGRNMGVSRPTVRDTSATPIPPVF